MVSVGCKQIDQGEIIDDLAICQAMARSDLYSAQQALQVNPGDVPMLMQATLAFRSLEMYSALKDVTDELVKQNPDSLFAWENFMRAWRGMGRYEEANEALDHVLELEPKDVRFWTMKADTLYRLERYREAASVAERAVRIDQEYPPALRIREKAVRMMYQRKGPSRSTRPQG